MLNFWPIEGAFIQRKHLFEGGGGANLRIYCIFFFFLLYSKSLNDWSPREQ